jgi:hypothetical protein
MVGAAGKSLSAGCPGSDGMSGLQAAMKAMAVRLALAIPVAWATSAGQLEATLVPTALATVMATLRTT